MDVICENHKMKYMRIFVLTCLSLFMTYKVYAQHPAQVAGAAGRREAALQSLIKKSSVGDAGKMRIQTTGEKYVRFLGVSGHRGFPTSGGKTVAGQDRARTFLLNNQGLFMDDSSKVDFLATRTTSRGAESYIRMKQLYSGIPVFCGEVLVQINDRQEVACVFTDIKRGLSDLESGAVGLIPGISADEARQRAVAMAVLAPSVFQKGTEISASGLTEARPKLWDDKRLASLEFEAGPAALTLFVPEIVGIQGETVLAWVLDLAAVDHPELAERILLDAQTGRCVFHYPLFTAALDRMIYDAANTDSDPGILVRSEGGASVALVDANYAYDYFGDTYNFYYGEHGRNSIDNAGMTISGTVRYCSPYDDCPYENAFWSDSTQRMYFGQDYASADDVVAHELTHGVTASESALIYFNESGAINESFSDMWGEWVDQVNGTGLDGSAYDWLMGEDLPIGAIRDMSNPPVYGDPDRMGSSYYSANIRDEGGVHFNSGVGNKLCYLLTDGDTFNGRTVSAMGISRTADLFYECQTNLLTSASDYSDLYALLIQAANNLSFTQAETNNVVEACLAVELGVQPVREAVGNAWYTWSFPMFTSYHDSRTQSIYLTSEIGRSGRISGLALYVDTIPGQTMNNWTIRLKTTTLSSFSSASFEGPSGWTTCFQGNVTVSSTGQAQFVFSTPFVYDGASNLMVDFSFNNSSYTTNGICYAAVPGGNRTVIGATDSNPTYPDPLLWSGTSLPSANRGLSTAMPAIALTFAAPSATVTNVTSSNPDGTYTTGEMIDINVAFSTAVDVTGTPRLELETGATNRYASYVGGTGTSTLTFRYTVVAGDTACDLEYVNAGALQPNGGTIKDVSTHTEAILTLPATGASGSLGTNKNIVIDTLAPVIALCATTPDPLLLGAECMVAMPDLTGEVAVSDNCGVPVVTQAPLAGTLISEDTLVTLTATDSAGLTDTCEVVVTVYYDCDDNSVCTIDICEPGQGCVHTAIDCDDNVACTVDTCDPATGCEHAPDDTLCDDNDVCNGLEACDAVSGCQAGTPLECDDTDACTDDACDPVAGCVHTPVDCDDSDPCTNDTCDPATGTCLHEWICAEGEGEPCVEIHTWVYLEGAAIDPGGSVAYSIPMHTTLNDLRILPGQTYEDLFLGTVYSPPGQPYSVAPWFYNGSEGDLYDSGGDPLNGDAGYPSTVVDWVLVSLRETADGAGGPVCQAAALLHKDGAVEFVGGSMPCCGAELTGPYYLVIEHHNHLIVMSDEPVAIVDNTLTYDFRDRQSYIDDPFGFGAAQQKEILPGVYAMYCGNGDQASGENEDTDLTSNDQGLWSTQNGSFGLYGFGDYIMNGDVNSNDLIPWELNNGKSTSVPRN